MEEMLRSEFIASPTAPVVVLFGGNPSRREEVIALVESIGGISVYGALSMAEGIELLKSLPQVALVLIGGRYTAEQRELIKHHIATHLKDVSVTEPGYEYPYDNELIKANIINRLASKMPLSSKT